MNKILEEVLSCPLIPGSSLMQRYQEIRKGEWNYRVGEKSGALIGEFCQNCENRAIRNLYRGPLAVDLGKLAIWVGIGCTIYYLMSQ